MYNKYTYGITSIVPSFQQRTLIVNYQQVMKYGKIYVFLGVI